MLVRGTIRDYSRRSPEPADVALVVEISDTSLGGDRKQTSVYGGGGIPVYWIVNLIDRQIEVYTGPSPGGYARREDLHPGQRVPVIIDRRHLGDIVVDDLLP